MLLHFQVWDVLMWQMNQCLKQTDSYNWFLSYWSSLQFYSSPSKWKIVEPLPQYILHNWISSKKTHFLLLTKICYWCDQILVTKFSFGSRMVFFSDHILVWDHLLIHIPDRFNRNKCQKGHPENSSHLDFQQKNTSSVTHRNVVLMWPYIGD